MFKELEEALWEASKAVTTATFSLVGLSPEQTDQVSQWGVHTGALVEGACSKPQLVVLPYGVDKTDDEAEFRM